MLQDDSLYYVLAYYLFTPIADPHAEVMQHKHFLKEKDFRCRIYISSDGINGQASGSKKDAEAYMEWIKQHPLFSNMVFKIHYHHENVFPRQTIKFRKKLVAIDEQIDLNNRGELLSPKQWKERLDSSKNVLLDVRNDYEWKVGRFEGAECPPCQTFREFNDYVAELKKNHNPETTPVMMYCTGGIRCELYSALLKKEGFNEVYQLDGGVINYGLKEGSEHWLGKLFVFDDRLTVPISEEKTEVISSCHHCGTANEDYYNCANMDCNRLFLCCPSCIKTYQGCCNTDCQSSPRLRPFHEQNPHKPFRKWYNYFNDKQKEEKELKSKKD